MLVLSNLVIDILCMLFIISLWHQSRKRFAGTDFWALAFAFETAGILLIVMRGRIPDLISMSLPNTLIIAGVILGYTGLGRFLGKKTSQFHNYVLLAAFACVHAYFVLVQPNLAVRNIIMSVGLLIICFQCMWLLVYRVDSGMRQWTTLGVGMVFGAYCLLSIVRIIGVITGAPQLSNYFFSGSFESLVWISYQALFILLTYSLVLMVNKRLSMEVNTQEEKFAKTFQSSPEVIMLARLSDGHIVEVNDSFLNISGYHYGEVIGKTTVDLHLWDKEKELRAAVNELSKSGKIQGKEFQFRKKSGEVITGLFSADIIRIKNEDFVLTSVSDITHRKRMEDALRKNKERFEILSETASRLLSTDEPQNVVNELCQKVMTYLDCDTFINYLVDEEKRRLHLNAYAGIPSEIGKQMEWLDYGVAVCGCAARDACRIVAEDIPNRPDERTELVKSFGIKAYACHPLLIAGRVIGTLSFGTRSRTTFTEEELSLMKTVTDRVAIAIEKTRLVEALRRSHGDLEMRVQERTKALQELNESLNIENQERLRVELELRDSENNLRQLSNALLNAQERERNLIAGEIHDSLGASLAATKFKVEEALKEMDGGNPQPRVALESVIPIIQGTIEEARRIQMSLRPSVLDDLGILATINWFCRQFESTYSNIHIKREIDIQEHETPEPLKIVIYRVLQEALNNIAKHSRASEVFLTLTKMNQAINLVIQDNGQGFNLEQASYRKGSTKGLGLDSMRERTELSGGSFSVESGTGTGTIVRATWLVE